MFAYQRAHPRPEVGSQKAQAVTSTPAGPSLA